MTVVRSRHGARPKRLAGAGSFGSWRVPAGRSSGLSRTIGPMARRRNRSVEMQPVRATGVTLAGPSMRGPMAIAALSVGAAAVGAFAIGRLAIGRASIKRLTIDELEVRRLRVEDLEVVSEQRGS